MTTHNSAQDAGGERNSASDMVERVVAALVRLNGSDWNAYVLAKTALEASHHAELVEFVRWVSRGRNQVAILADELLAKIGGDQP